MSFEYRKFGITRSFPTTSNIFHNVCSFRVQQSLLCSFFFFFFFFQHFSTMFLTPSKNYFQREEEEETRTTTRRKRSVKPTFEHIQILFNRVRQSLTGMFVHSDYIKRLETSLHLLSLNSRIIRIFLVFRFLKTPRSNCRG